MGKYGSMRNNHVPSALLGLVCGHRKSLSTRSDKIRNCNLAPRVGGIADEKRQMGDIARIRKCGRGFFSPAYTGMFFSEVSDHFLPGCNQYLRKDTIQIFK